MSRVFVFALVLFVFTTASASRFVYSAENVAFTDVASKDQLWRFLVGDGEAFTIGDRYICLQTYRDRVVQAYSDSLSTYGLCYDTARFELEFLGGNEVRLKSKAYHRYVSCSLDGSARVTDWHDESAVFQLSISPDEDEVIFYNPYVDGTLSTEGGSVSCNGYPSERASKFSGWKLGPKESWEASDEWQLVGYFDNRYSSSKTKFAYATSVGVEVSATTQARVDAYERVQIGPDMHDAFTKSISPETDVAWKFTPPNVWAETTMLKGSIEVAPNTLTKLYQAVGQYGVFTIRTNYIQARDEEKETAILHVLTT